MEVRLPITAKLRVAQQVSEVHYLLLLTPFNLCPHSTYCLVGLLVRVVCFKAQAWQRGITLVHNRGVCSQVWTCVRQKAAMLSLQEIIQVLKAFQTFPLYVTSSDFLRTALSAATTMTMGTAGKSL